MKINIVGRGAIGSLLAARCYKLGFEYEVLLREPISDGLEFIFFNSEVCTLTPVVKTPKDAFHADLMLLPLKAYQIENALQLWEKQITPETTIVLFNNGMGPHETVPELLPNNSILACTTSYGALKTSVNGATETGIGETHAGWLRSPKAERKQVIEALTSQLLPPTVWHKDISMALWKKLAINSVINPLTAIHNIQNGKLSENHYQKTIDGLITEFISVTSHLGLNFSANDVSETLYQVINKTAANYSSMHQDVHQGNTTEVDFINGFLLQKARLLGLSIPINEEMYKKTKDLEQEGH